MAAQGGSNGAIDNDDESLRYDNNHNFQVYGHQKFKTGAIRSYGNVIACKRTGITSDFPAGLSDILVHRRIRVWRPLAHPRHDRRRAECHVRQPGLVR